MRTRAVGFALMATLSPQRRHVWPPTAYPCGRGFSSLKQEPLEEEIEEFLKEISGIKAPKITKAELKKYLEAFPKEYSSKEISFMDWYLFENKTKI